MEKDTSNFKSILLFICGIIVVGTMVFILKSQTNKSVETGTNVPIETPIIKQTSDDLVNETSNSGKEAKNMSDQKMTTEQKLAVKAPGQVIDVTKSYQATFKTSMGTIVVSLDAKNRPQTVNSFVYLAKQGFYDGVIFHRIISNFMIQGGDPTGTGMGGPAYKFNDELSEPNSNAKGTIAMANAGPDTNGSQFFVNLVDNIFLDTKHSVFGKVVEGMDVVEAMGKVKTGANDKPVTPVTIETIEIAEK